MNKEAAPAAERGMFFFFCFRGIVLRFFDYEPVFSVGFTFNSTVFCNVEEFLLQTEPPAMLEFGPGEGVFEFEVVPLFGGDDGVDDADQVFFTLLESPLDYQLLPASATVGRTLHPWWPPFSTGREPALFLASVCRA